jgi:hypothetical protein
MPCFLSASNYKYGTSLAQKITGELVHQRGTVTALGASLASSRFVQLGGVALLQQRGGWHTAPCSWPPHSVTFSAWGAESYWLATHDSVRRTQLPGVGGSASPITHATHPGGAQHPDQNKARELTPPPTFLVCYS